MKFELSETEREILNFLWDNGHWTSGAEFWDYFNSTGSSRKRQTINTYLTRMVDKGLLIKHDKKYMYRYNKKEFESKKAEEILITMYDGSFKKFLSALTGSKKINENEANDLKKYIDSL